MPLRLLISRALPLLALPLAAVPAQTPLPGSLAADRARSAPLLGAPAGDSAAMPVATPRLRLRVLRPEVRTVWNSDIPFGGNDGPLWAGRGLSASVTAGVAVQSRAAGADFGVVLAPIAAYSQNRPFEIVAGADPARSAYASPWHTGAASADLPLRFGDRPVRTLDPGWSAVWMSAGGVAVRATASPMWWGPGLRTALVMSSNAAGIPRVQASTARPLRTPIGAVHAELLAGALTESPFFDTLAANDYRALSGLLLTLRPAVEPGLELGLSRVVYAPVARRGEVPRHALDVITRWESIAGVGDTLENGRTRQRADQLLSLFGRWSFPASGFEFWGEWARMEVPRSLREWLIAPQHTQGWLLGLQGVRRAGAGHLRAQGELAYLEQSTTFADRPPPDFYTGRATSQGWTQRGQPVGSATGPGSSSQFLAVDWLLRDAQAGLFAGRVRWENDAMYRQPTPYYLKHDVTLLGGLRGGGRTPWADAFVELSIGNRLNYLFKNGTLAPRGYRTVDIHNVSIAVTLSPSPLASPSARPPR